MESPFQVLTDAFQQQYRVNFSLERLDGSIVLTLSTKDGVTARRMIRSSQLQDPEQLQRVIRSVRFGIAVEHGPLVPQMLASMARSGHSLLIAS